jgi:hypothetical protein
MHGTAAYWQGRLRKEFGDNRIVVRWNDEIERFQVGYVSRLGAADLAEWFYTVSDGNSGYRIIDHRIIHKLRTLDKAHQPNWTPARYRKWLEEEKEALNEKKREDLRYRIAHETRFAKGRFWRVAPEVNRDAR